MTTNTTNTENAITAKTPAQKPAQKLTPTAAMNAIVNSENTKKMMNDLLHENAGAFVASVIDLYGTDTYLQNCAPGDVFKVCLQAASLKLPVNKQLGFSWIIPRRNKGVWQPVFQLGYKGLIQLALRSGVYKHINADVVYEGEFVSYNKVTGEADMSGTATSNNVVGYFAYLETLNGFSKCLYWSKEQVILHASKYSDSYKNGADIWKKNFDEMAIKTVLSAILHKYAPLSVDMQTAHVFAEDAAADFSAEDPIPVEHNEEPQTADETVDTATGEISYEGTPFDGEQ